VSPSCICLLLLSNCLPRSPWICGTTRLTFNFLWKVVRFHLTNPETNPDQTFNGDALIIHTFVCLLLILLLVSFSLLIFNNVIKFLTCRLYNIFVPKQYQLPNSTYFPFNKIVPWFYDNYSPAGPTMQRPYSQLPSLPKPNQLSYVLTMSYVLYLHYPLSAGSSQINIIAFTPKRIQGPALLRVGIPHPPVTIEPKINRPLIWGFLYLARS
jgi:hypothetical protein